MTRNRPSARQIARHGGDGVIVTLEHRESGERVSVHRAHRLRTEALRAAVARFDQAGWRVDTISTPQTIYEDVICARPLTPLADRDRGSSAGRRGIAYDLTHSTGGVKTPERALLAHAGLQAYR